MERKMSKKGLVGLAAVMVGTAIASVYTGGILFFKDSFYFGSSIGNLDIGGHTVEAAQIAVENRGENTRLSLYGRGVEKEVIKGEDFDLKYSIEEDIADLKAQQSPFLWPASLVTNGNIEVTQTITYDEEKLMTLIDELTYFDEEKVIMPTDADVAFNGNEYVIIPEDEGRMLNRQRTKDAIVEALEEGRTVVDLDAQGCYERPKYTRESPEILEAQKLINASVYTEIIYLFGDIEERVTPQMLSKWLSLNENEEVTVDEAMISDYIDGLANKYDTLGVTRDFTTARGNVVQVSGGDYGWSIDKEAEKKALMAAIKAGERIYREPIAHRYGAKSYMDTDIGDTYVEVDLSSQYLWFFKEGKLLVEGGIVTGDRSRRRETPQGTYKLDYKQRNATLRGPGYATPVSFWMPFNGGIGIHDATWRGSFGGSIYKNNGSHGCVNAPYNMAKTIFNNIEAGMPIVCHY